jgi:hypothetical protein
MKTEPYANKANSLARRKSRRLAVYVDGTPAEDHEDANQRVGLRRNVELHLLCVLVACARKQ